MSCRRWFVALALVGLFVSSSAALAQDGTGQLEGTVFKDGKGVAGVVVILNEARLTEVTDSAGKFVFLGVPAGTYTLILTLGNNTETRPDVVVSAGRTMNVEVTVEWNLGASERVTVTALARAAKIVDAPAAVTAIPEEEIERSAATGQVPKVLEFTPGAEVTQSGLYDFNFNTRGFNSSLNRRVSTYIDGRDVGVVLLGAQEWAAISGGLDDIASLEFVRGPSAALYGANASSGVINITTKAPRDSIGTLFRASAGTIDTFKIDPNDNLHAVSDRTRDVSFNFRRAGQLRYGWYYKLTAGSRNSGDYTVSRNPDVVDFPEYYPFEPTGQKTPFCMLVGETECLVAERTLLREQDNDIRFGSFRLDRYFGEGALLTLEAGASDIEGPVFQTGIGRVQVLNAKRPFYRVNYSTSHWNLLGHYSSRNGNQVNLTQDLLVDYSLITDTQRYGVEAQGNWNFLADRVRFVVGAAYTKEHVDSKDPKTGRQTVVYEPIDSHREAIFSQFDWRANDHFKVVLAGRIDASTLHDTQFSPKAAVVYSINPKHSLRMTYNRAFQVANYSEFYLHTKISNFPIGGFVRTICEAPILPMPVDCGISENFIPILAVGNNDLQLEKTSAWELGYSGLYGKRVFVTVDYYNSENKDFITDLVPQVGTILGNLDGCVDSAGNPQTDVTKCPINNDYKPWVSTDEAENTFLFGTLTVAQALRNAVDNSVGGSTLGFRLAQDLDGGTVVVGRTYSNVGLVNTQGVDFGLQYFISDDWSAQFSYSWFDFEIVDSDPRIEEILLPNTPEHKASVSLTFNRGKWWANAAARWVHEFYWSTGVFQGPVPEYSTVDLSGNYRISDLLSTGINISNARDTVHRQTFGGDMLGRRVLAHLTVEW